MQFENLLVGVEDSVATIAINRPDVRNALNTPTLSEPHRAFEKLASDATVRAVVLRGAGDVAFCAGADLKEVATLADIPARRRYFGGIAAVLETIHRMPQPVIARVAGYALAGGMGLAVGCDFVVAADNAEFGLPEITLGLFPMVVMAPILRLCGPRAAVELAMLGERIDARRAYDLGLVTRLVPLEQLDSEVRRMASRMKNHSALVNALGKRAIYDSASMDYLGALRYLSEMVTIVASSDDLAEGVKAFLEKRTPQFRDR
jgi:enoyl-CoA hydratase